MLLFLSLVLGQPEPLPKPPAGPVVTVSVPAPGAKPQEVPARAGRAVRLQAAGTGPLRWLLASEADADLIPAGDGSAAAFVADKPGRYVLVVYGGGEATRVVVVVGDSPAPSPGPDPKPPAPPPVDELRARLKTAFDADPPGLKKDDTRRLLVELCRQTAVLVMQADIETAGELATRWKAAASSLAAGELTGTRKAVAAELAKLFPVDAELTGVSRLAAADLFRRLAAALDSLGG